MYQIAKYRLRDAMVVSIYQRFTVLPIVKKSFPEYCSGLSLQWHSQTASKLGVASLRGPNLLRLWVSRWVLTARQTEGQRRCVASTCAVAVAVLLLLVAVPREWQCQTPCHDYDSMVSSAAAHVQLEHAARGSP
jgi:hypothetical protein